jgi:hypothetical protein
MRYLDLFQALNEHQVRYLLVGGLAMNLHGVPRMTMDVDLVLALDSGNFARFLACAQAIGLTPIAPVSLVALADPVQRKDWVENKHMIAFGLRSTTASLPLTVDILIAPPIDIEAALNRASLRDVGGTPVALASIADMIQLKQHAGRAQDRSDIEHLERLRER